MLYQSYVKLLSERRVWYKTLKKVKCECLKADIVFNAKGFYHLLYDGFGKPRSNAERIKRLNLLRHVPIIIKNAQQVAWKQQLRGTMFIVLRKQILDEHSHLTYIRVIIRETAECYYYHSVFDE